jgi:3-oxo-5-alpha-steroid 4-dehydrogenase 1
MTRFLLKSYLNLKMTVLEKYAGLFMLQVIYSILLYSQFIIAAVVFIALFFITAPYGRYAGKGWGPIIKAKYAWVWMEFPAFFVILLFYVLGRGYTMVVPTVFILIWELHYIQRTFVYPFIIQKSRKNFPVVVILMGLFFNCMNGFINGYNLYHNGADYGLSWLLDIRFTAGAAIFLAGFSINLYADRVLRLLRERNKKDYSIPQGGLYELISSPNYFGEIIEWTGWAVLTWSLPGLAFAVFTIANLFPRAYANHKWYQKTFPDYPVKRKAIIPFLF